MQHFRSLDYLNLENAYITVGSFDGVHLGHQYVIRQLCEEAHASHCQAVVITFFPHPEIILNQVKDLQYLTTLEQRVKLLDDLGVDVIITQDFNLEFANFTAKEFVALLKKKTGMQQLWAGYDFAMGRDRSGQGENLFSLSSRYNFGLHITPAFTMDGEIVSSSRIGRVLKEGNVECAAKLLGGYFNLDGLIVKGEGRGREIGIPTANLSTFDQIIIPSNGVYATWTSFEGFLFKSVVNIGVRPTFNGKTNPRKSIEIHLINYDSQLDLHDKMVSVQFVQRIRDEKRFPSSDALAKQIHHDIQQARKILK